MKNLLIFTFSILCLTINAQVWTPVKDNPVELGLVKWERDYDKALIKSKKENKPVFILFQEVPGCSTCTNYGKQVMSHPLIVEAIEDHFIPLCIYNNKGGSDKKVLDLYGEPTWNNPVVRIVDFEGKNLIPRVNGGYSINAVSLAIIKGLENERKEVPKYLSLLHKESSTTKTRETVLGMFCFWSGEKAVSKINGVVASEAGFMNGKEVVKITYDPAVIDEENIAKKARSQHCADIVFTDGNVNGIPTGQPGKFRKDPESKYYIYKSKYKSIPMTPLQALKVNYELSQGGDPAAFLSPRQLSLLDLKSRSNNIGKNVSEAWLDLIKNAG